MYYDYLKYDCMENCFCNCKYRNSMYCTLANLFYPKETPDKWSDEVIRNLNKNIIVFLEGI